MTATQNYMTLQSNQSQTMDQQFGELKITLVLTWCNTEHAGFCVGVGKYTPNVSIDGEMGQVLPNKRQWLNVIRHWCRLMNMDSHHLSKRIFLWAMSKKLKTGVIESVFFIHNTQCPIC